MGVEDVGKVPPVLVSNLKDQMLIALVKRAVDDDGVLLIPVAEVDDTGQDLMHVMCDVENRNFVLTITAKS